MNYKELKADKARIENKIKGFEKMLYGMDQNCETAEAIILQIEWLKPELEFIKGRLK